MSDDQPKMARDMTPQERAEKLAELKRGPKPEWEPLPDKTAKEMSPREREAWLREHKRRVG
jgi:ribosomal protein L29